MLSSTSGAVRRSVADFVGTAETFHDDFRTVIAEINRRAGLNVTVGTMKRRNTRPAPGSDPDGSDQATRQCSMGDFPHMDEEVVRDIALQYALDAVRFGYIRGYVPQLQR